MYCIAVCILSVGKRIVLALLMTEVSYLLSNT